MNAKRADMLFLAGLVVTTVVAALLSISMNQYLHRPPTHIWELVDKFVATQKEPGDGVAFFPPWMAGYARDEKRFVGLDYVDRRELLGTGPHVAPRVWTIACFDALNVKKVTAAGWELLRETTIERVTIRLFSRRNTAVLFRWSDRLAETDLASRFNGQAAPWRRYVFHHNEHAMTIRPETAVFRGLPHQGVLMPLHAGRETLVRVDQLPEGELVVCGGLTDTGIYRLDNHPFEAWVYAADRAPALIRFPAETGWRCRAAGAAEAPLQMVLRSDSATDRQFLVDLFVRRAAPAPPAAS